MRWLYGNAVFDTFFIALLAVSFIRLLITNSAIYAVKVRKFTDKKRFILKASVFSELGILISFFLFSLIWTVMCLCVSNFDNIFKKIADSILFGFLGNLTITGSGHYSGIIVAFLKFSQPTHLYICLIRPLYIKIWMFPKNRKANYFTLFHCAMYRICCLFRFLKLVL